jgi:uncharacterized repeat protein (TIGR03803 family)
MSDDCFSRTAATASLVFAVMLVLGAVATSAAHAQTYKVLYRFPGQPDGIGPVAGLVLDSGGNLYGTTVYGGASNIGTVFKLRRAGTEAWLYSFTGGTKDGAYPKGGVTRDLAGNLYGTTYGSGAFQAGTVFKADKQGHESVLYSFAGQPTDGGLPTADMIRDTAGNLYGNTAYGGASNNGTVFKLRRAGTETWLYSFTGGPKDGAIPNGGLIRDAAGNLYGTTLYGGKFNLGTVYKLDKNGHETVLHSFAGTDGANPQAGLIWDAAGNFYGTAEGGGDFAAGVVFKLAGKKETVLYSFTGTDGASPQAGLLLDPAGDFYGTTYAGGNSNKGTVFKLDKNRNETVLHPFTGGTDGAHPYAGLVRDTAGNLYGTTSEGGDLNCSPNGCGTVFMVKP